MANPDLDIKSAGMIQCCIEYPSFQ